MKRLRHNWEFAAWACCMLFGGAMLLSQLAVASRPGLEDSFLARQAVDAVLDEEAAAPVPSQPEPVVVAHAKPARPAVVKPDVHVASDLLIEAIIQVESAGNPRRVGGHGERGLMQLKARTWAETTRELFGRKLPFDQAFNAEINRKVGRAYLATLHVFLMKHRSEWKADERSLLLACYNAGPHKVKRSGFALGELPRSTQDYIARASALHDDMLLDAVRVQVAGEPADAGRGS
jgi:soluble lytic murein transglycosylase-like protein